jgi:hypothetical protein
MRRAPIVVLAVMLVAGCSHHRAPVAQTAAVQTPSPSPTPAFSDLAGAPQAPYVDQLARLGVFFPPGGLFEPNKPVLRREFVRWLMHADAAIWAETPGVAIAPSHSDAQQFFTDVPSDDPDYTLIEGMHEAGIPLARGKRFDPNAPITREQALAIKAYVDCGAPDPTMTADAAQAYLELPPWKDKRSIGRTYVAAIASCLLQDTGTVPADRLDTIARTFGNVVSLQPLRALTRAEAAAMIWRIGQQKPDLSNFPPRSAAQALAQQAE